MTAMIDVSHLTHDYGHGRGVFDVTFDVQRGEVLGFLGPNGAGKSTTMRHLMGFSRPQEGAARIGGLDCWGGHARIMRDVGYIPGEVALPDGLDGAGFLTMMQSLRGADSGRTGDLLDYFEMDPHASVKRMSIGEKRKLAIVAAFMGDPDILLLDEPTSGLDPVMQERFIDFVKGEKAKGKTVLLSSHIFNEVEALCDRIAIIKEGRIVSVVSADEVRHFKRKSFDVTFADPAGYEDFRATRHEIKSERPRILSLSVAVDDAHSDEFIKTLSHYNLRSVVEHSQTLEDYFMHFYKSDRTFQGVSDEK